LKASVITPPHFSQSTKDLNPGILLESSVTTLGFSGPNLANSLQRQLA
jgi:hypothetical protein